jgi:hypothetical protein
MTNSNVSKPAIQEADPSVLMEQKNQEFDNQLETLKGEAKFLKGLRIEGNKVVYKHLVQLQQFWKEANKHVNYLDQYYEKKKYKRQVNHGINFAPLIEQIWGEKCLSTNKINRWSRALNKVHAEYESNPFYQEDTVNKLVAFIENSKGVNGLADYGTKPGDLGDEVADEIADAELTKKSTYLESEIENLNAAALTYYTNFGASKRQKFNGYVPAGENDLSVLLVKKYMTGDFIVIDARPENASTKKLIGEKYATNFSCLYVSLRALFETMATQCLPGRLQSAYKRVLDFDRKNKEKESNSAIRRLTYKDSDKSFIMSPILGYSGVVTIAKPKATVIESIGCDVFMSTVSRRAVEANIIGPRKFNLYEPKPLDKYQPIPSSDQFSHVLNLTSRVVEDKKIPVIFDSQVSKKELADQLTVDLDALNNPIWEIKVNGDWVQELHHKFTQQWVKSHGNHLKRDHQKTFQFQLQNNNVRIKFFDEEGVYAYNATFAVNSDAVQGTDCEQRYLSSDFATAIYAIGQFELVGDVTFTQHKELLGIHYETDAAAYSVYIPGCDEKANRYRTGLIKYKLQLAKADATDQYSGQSDDEIGEEFNEPA